MNRTMSLIDPPKRSLADLVRELGDIPLDRIRLDPPPGTATLKDLLHAKGCELVEGTLVEKAMGLRESLLALLLGSILRRFVIERNLGMVAGEKGTLEILTGLVRIPDVAYISWDHFPGRVIPEEPIPSVVPDLAVEVASRSNTSAEMARKRDEYFQAGVQLVWMVDRFAGTVTVYTSPTAFHTLTEGDTLDGGSVLPGLTIPVSVIFGELRRHG